MLSSWGTLVSEIKATRSAHLDQTHAIIQLLRAVLDVVAPRVDGLPPGLYRVDSGRGRPTPRRAGDLADALVDVCTRQEKAGEAAVAFFMVGRIPQAAATRGERSYRELLFASGAMGERIYLAAESLGLAARNLAAFNDDDLNALLGLDGRNEAVLHLTVVGPGN